MTMYKIGDYFLGYRYNICIYDQRCDGYMGQPDSHCNEDYLISMMPHNGNWEQLL